MKYKKNKHLNFTKIQFLSFAAFLILLFPSCTAERELAREFVNAKKDTPILLLTTDQLILSNEKLKRIPDFDSLIVSTQDSLWLANTLFLDTLNDVQLISAFKNKLKAELQYYGFKVYEKDSIEIFNTIENTKYTLKIAQFEAVEDNYIYRDEEVFPNSLVYYYNTTLNQVILNFWFEFSSSAYKNEKIFFAGFPVSDKLESRFVIDNNTDKVSYQYKITPITLNEIYQLAEYSAQHSTNYLFNYLMNKYIKENLPSNVLIPKFFSYDRHSGFLYNNEKEQFTEIDSK